MLRLESFPRPSHSNLSVPFFLLTFLALFVAAAATVRAATFTVNSTADGSDSSPGDGICSTDGSDCTLRAAIVEANAFAGDDAINFSSLFNSPQTIMTIGLAIQSNLTITGPGAQLLTVTGNSIHQIFNINAGATTVSLSGMRIAEGNTPTDGSAIFINSGITVMVTGCLIDNNTAGRGGGISNFGTLMLEQSAVSNNTSETSNFLSGGGIYNAGNLTVNNSTISGNTNHFGGGGIMNDRFSTATITNSTITNNTDAGAAIGASGVMNFASDTTVTVGNSIIAANIENANRPDVKGPFISSGYNFVGNIGNVTDFNQTGDQTGTSGAPLNPLLAPLALNGGTTPTHALFVGSPAVDKGKSFGSILDQRGLPRPIDILAILPAVAGDNSDIGAFELQGLPFETGFDFDGDRRADIAVYRPSGGDWYLRQSGLGGSLRTVFDWGDASLADQLVPADYDGDDKTDVAVFRPSEGNWYIIQSATNTPTVKNWGGQGDLPVPADYDADGRTDVAVFRPSEGNWYILNSATSTGSFRGWGNGTDTPVPGDYDGDRRADIAVFRPSEGNWYIINSSNNSITLRQWGISIDVPLPADYDGDGKTDVCVWRPTEGDWHIIRSMSNTAMVRGWGAGSLGDIPVAADYDGDGRADLSVWRESEGNWYIIASATDTVLLDNLGLSADVPIPSAYQY